MFTDPVKNLKAFGIKEDAIIADLGAGTGYYSVAAGKMAPRGKVYAVEIVKDYLATIKRKVQEARLNNVEIIWGNIENKNGTLIGDGIVDSAIASNVLSQVENKEKFILEAKRILKSGAKILLIDWSEGDILRAKNNISQNKAREIFEKSGFAWQRDIDAGAHHYGMIFKKT